VRDLPASVASFSSFAAISDSRRIDRDSVFVFIASVNLRFFCELASKIVKNCAADVDVASGIGYYHELMEPLIIEIESWICSQMQCKAHAKGVSLEEFVITILKHYVGIEDGCMGKSPTTSHND